MFPGMCPELDKYEDSYSISNIFLFFYHYVLIHFRQSFKNDCTNSYNQINSLEYFYTQFI